MREIASIIEEKVNEVKSRCRNFRVVVVMVLMSIAATSEQTKGENLSGMQGA